MSIDKTMYKFQNYSILSALIEFIELHLLIYKSGIGYKSHEKGFIYLILFIGDTNSIPLYRGKFE
jgi:hypothetical protein